MSRRDGAIVARLEVPGTAPPRKYRPVGYGVTISRRSRKWSMTTRNTSGIGCARSYRTLRDGSFEGAFPGTSCQATIGLSLWDRAVRSGDRSNIKESFKARLQSVIESARRRKWRPEAFRHQSKSRTTTIGEADYRHHSHHHDSLHKA
jgi:hypothetical protein